MSATCRGENEPDRCQYNNYGVYGNIVVPGSTWPVGRLPPGIGYFDHCLYLKSDERALWGEKCNPDTEGKKAFFCEFSYNFEE